MDGLVALKREEEKQRPAWPWVRLVGAQGWSRDSKGLCKAPEAGAHHEGGCYCQPFLAPLASVGRALSTPMWGRKEPAQVMESWCFYLICCAV